MPWGAPGSFPLGASRSFLCLQLGEDRYDCTGYAVDVAIASIVPGHEQSAKAAFRVTQERHQPLYFPQRIFRFHLDFARLARLYRRVVVKRQAGGHEFLRIAAVHVLQANLVDEPHPGRGEFANAVGGVAAVGDHHGHAQRPPRYVVVGVGHFDGDGVGFHRQRRYLGFTRLDGHGVGMLVFRVAVAAPYQAKGQNQYDPGNLLVHGVEQQFITVGQQYAAARQEHGPGNVVADPEDAQSHPQGVPEDAVAEVEGLGIDGLAGQQFDGVGEVIPAAGDVHPGGRAGNRACILDVDHGVHVMATRDARLELDFKGVVASDLERARDHGRLAVQLGGEAHEHRAGAAYVEEGAARFAHRPRPVLGQVEFAGHAGKVVDLGGLGTPFHVVPLDGPHAQEGFLRTLAVGRCGRDVQHQGHGQGGHAVEPEHAQFDQVLCFHLFDPLWKAFFAKGGDVVLHGDAAAGAL